jgi:hypothetical protein
MTGQRTLAEILRALLVLALVFLNFAHQPTFAAPSAQDVLTAVASQSFCGEPIADDGEHAPCHACRIASGADLPPVTALPCPPLPVALRPDAEPVALAIQRYAPLTAGARAPPAA